MTTTSIRRRLIGRLLVGMIALSAISYTLLYVYLRVELYEQYDEALLTEARAVAGMLSAEDIDDDLPSLLNRSFPRMHFGTAENSFLQVWDEAGAVVLRSPSLGDSTLTMQAPLSPLDESQADNVTLPDSTSGRAVSISFIEATSDESPRTSRRRYVLMLAERRDELDYTLTHLAIALAIIGGALTATSVALLVYGVRRELKPLNTFSEQVARVDASTLAYRFAEADMCDELIPISRRLNDLLARLDGSFNRERRFSANVAHELRTPIAELRAMIEVAIKWPPDSAGVARLHVQILEISERMSRLVDAMFSLSRLEHLARDTPDEHHALQSLVAAAWTAHASLARSRGLEIDFSIDPAITAPGDRTMLEALLGNILANAAQHASPGTRINCTAISATDDVGPRLIVSNAASELQPADLPRLDEPFWRKDAARTHGERLGLGLSLVRDYAKALSLEVRYTMPAQEVFAAEVRWPALLPLTANATSADAAASQA